MQPVVYEEGELPPRRPSALERRRARKGRWGARHKERLLRRRFSTRRWPAVREPSLLGGGKFGEEKGKGKPPRGKRGPLRSPTGRPARRS